MTDRIVRAGLVIAAAGFAVHGLLSLLEQPVPREADLREVTGKLAQPIVTVRAWRSQTTAYVGLVTAAGTEIARVPHLCFVWEDCTIPPSISGLRPGESLTAWLTPPALGRSDQYIWRIRHGETTLLSFDAVALANAAQRMRYLLICGTVCAVGLLISAFGFITRPRR